MSDITATVRPTAISAAVVTASVGGTVAGQVQAPGAAVAAVVGQASGGHVSGIVGGGPSLVGIVTVGGGAAPAGDSWNGNW